MPFFQKIVPIQVCSALKMPGHFCRNLFSSIFFENVCIGYFYQGPFNNSSSGILFEICEFLLHTIFCNLAYIYFTYFKGNSEAK